jgi:hypothetical protein
MSQALPTVMEMQITEMMRVIERGWTGGFCWIYWVCWILPGGG